MSLETFGQKLLNLLNEKPKVHFELNKRHLTDMIFENRK